MKNVFLGSLFVVAAVGCTSTEVGHIAANWQLADIAFTGPQTAGTTPTACPPGFDTAELHTVAASPDGTAVDACTSPSSDCYIDQFNCSDNTGVSAALPAQNYLTWIAITDHSGTQVYATSTAAFVDITSQDLSFNAQILNNGGYFRLTWSLMGESSGQTIPCAQTDAASSLNGSVETVATVSGGANMLADKFNCEDHFGYTAGLPSGGYTVAVDALNSANQALGSQSTVVPGTITTIPNDITDLGHLVLLIQGQ
jgi:hypothetical protein